MVVSPQVKKNAPQEDRVLILRVVVILASSSALRFPMSQIKFSTNGWLAVIAEDFTFCNVERVA